MAHKRIVPAESFVATWTLEGAIVNVAIFVPLEMEQAGKGSVALFADKLAIGGACGRGGRGGKSEVAAGGRAATDGGGAAAGGRPGEG